MNQNLVKEYSKTAVSYEYVFKREPKYEFIGEPKEAQTATYFHPMNFSNSSHCHLELTPQKTHPFLWGYLWTQKFLCSQHQRLRALHTLSSTQTLCPSPMLGHSFSTRGPPQAAGCPDRKAWSTLLLLPSPSFGTPPRALPAQFLPGRRQPEAV